MTPDVEPTFSHMEALRFGWHQTRANLKPFLTLGAIGLILSLMNQALSTEGAAPHALRSLMAVVVQILQAALMLVYVRAALRLYGGQPVDLSRPGDLLADFFPYLLTCVLYSLV